MTYKIEYLFSKNEKIGSKLISWGSSLFPEDIKNLDPNKIPSHVAVLINETFVIESVMEAGVRIIPFKQWCNKNQLLYRLPCSKPERSAEEVQELLFEMWGKKYDKKGILYFAYCLSRRLFFKIPLPESNKWEREDYFFCTEFAARLGGYNYSMTTPAKMCSDFMEVLVNVCE